MAIWLLCCCAMIFAMAVIGAITRLTESGLSIMEWAPVTGILPPLSPGEWERVFALYREIPEYQEINRGMTLAEFKTIFWWEYIHRLWGRLIGLVFAVPFLWFLLRGRIPRRLAPHLVVMFLLGGLQGAMGWYMVASGFAERTDVSQYRLVVHLLLAVAIYGYILWVALGLLRPAADRHDGSGSATALWAAVLGFLALVIVNIASGGFVAGLNAGLIYNSFPLMNGDLVPPEYGALQPWYWNLFENVGAVQFNHRALAIATALASLALWLWSRGQPLDRFTRHAFTWLVLAAALQIGLGIATLLLVVPVWLGAFHQAGALVLFSVTIVALHGLHGLRRHAKQAEAEIPYQVREPVLRR